MALRTTPVQGPEDIRAFFDRLAPAYRDSHGNPQRALRYRLSIIRRLLHGVGRELLVEIGCGTGLHLLALADDFCRAHGTDLSPEMIRRADEERLRHPSAERLSLAVDPAERLDSVVADTADAVLCVGALEHMPDQASVLRQVRRVLKPGGAFLCLTPNGEHLWYRTLAPRLGFSTQHLSSDRFLDRAELVRLLVTAGLVPETVGWWTFVPRGDLPRPVAWAWSGLDVLGRLCRVPRWRGGLYCKAVRPAGPRAFPPAGPAGGR
ncbi:class I SAM-dependent methyltransferase [Candidatus Methylocalor cossyra]|uniref:3-demethylubiquinone-9 3-methyltransferase n=1 Tax=Candidatus Methylocalor cossyra TaxID=3108543 RepID=A0ABP1CDW6_9GAMM